MICHVQRGPSLLPRELMLRLGSDVVATTTGRIQQHAATVILETARCASRAGGTVSGSGDGVPECASSESGVEPGCATAELGEISVLLDGLQSASVALREVSIQVSTSCTLLLTYLSQRASRGCVCLELSPWVRCEQVGKISVGSGHRSLCRTCCLTQLLLICIFIIVPFAVNSVIFSSGHGRSLV